MTLNGAIKQLHDLGCAEDMPIYYKPVIAEVINVLLMDVQEVRHGYWQDGKCAICNAEAPYTEDGFWNETTYCPSCGALMDKEEGV